MTEPVWKKFDLWMECPNCHEQSPIMGEIPKDIWKMVIKLKISEQVNQE